MFWISPHITLSFASRVDWISHNFEQKNTGFETLRCLYEPPIRFVYHIGLVNQGISADAPRGAGEVDIFYINWCRPAISKTLQ